MSDIKVSIIIAIRNNFAWTKMCLDSLCEKSNLSEDKEIIIVDNGSKPNVNSYLKNQFADSVNATNAKYILIENTTNGGSYHAWNQAIEKSNGKYICIAHNDCIFTHGWLDGLLNFMESYNDELSDVGIVSPSTNYVGELEHLSSKEMMDVYTKLKYAPKLSISVDMIQDLLDKTYNHGIESYSEIVSKGRKKNFVFTNNIATFCFLAKSSIYDKYGLFDDEFYPHTYAEKILKFKLEIDGIMTACCFDSYVHHNGNTTSDGTGHDLPMIEELNKSLYDLKMKEFYEENLVRPY